MQLGTSYDLQRFSRSDSWSIYERLHDDPVGRFSAHAHWLRVRERAANFNFAGTTLPTIYYSKSAGPQALTHRGTSIWF